MRDLVSGDLRVRVATGTGTIQLVWQGESSFREPAGLLKPFFEEVIERCQDMDLTIDFRNLDYMNSSTVRPIIEFVQEAKGRAKHVSVLYYDSVTWQRLSFRVIKALARDWENVTVDG